jgi:hypothetical protein
MNTSRHASNPRGSSAPNLSIEELIDAQPLSVRQLAIVALCFAVAALDGLDLAIVGFVAPAIRAEWQLHANDLALLFSAGLLGLTALPALAVSASIAILGRIHSVTDFPQLQPFKIQQVNPIPAAPPMGQETYSVH